MDSGRHQRNYKEKALLTGRGSPESFQLWAGLPLQDRTDRRAVPSTQQPGTSHASADTPDFPAGQRGTRQAAAEEVAASGSALSA